MKILLLEDDILFNTAITLFLETKNHEVTSLEDGEDALSIIDEHEFDLYILDLNIPSVSGLEVLRYIRSIDIFTPILVVTGSLEINNLIKAFEDGCNEYLKKPFHLRELEIRINKLLNNNSEVIKLNDNMIFYKNKKKLIVDDEVIELRKKEKRLLELLLVNIGKIVTYEIISDYVWENEFKDTYPIRQLVNSVRRKLPNDLIKTEIGVGYTIEN